VARTYADDLINDQLFCFHFVYISLSSSYNCPFSKLNSLLSSSSNLCQISRNCSRLPPSQCPQSKPPHTLSPSLSSIGKHVAYGSDIEPFFQRKSWSGKTTSRPGTSTRKRQMMAARRRAYRIIGGKRSSGAASLSASSICRCYMIDIIISVKALTDRFEHTHWDDVVWPRRWLIRDSQRLIRRV
jgi:hypothetical protein